MTDAGAVLTGAARAPFEPEAVVYLVQPARRNVADLDQLLDAVRTVDGATLFLHTQMPRLRPDTGDDGPVDDLSGWVRGVVQDVTTAERLAFAIAAARPEIDDVRARLVEVLESIPQKTRAEQAAPEGGRLELLRFEVVRVPTGMPATTADELFEALSRCDRTTWFHHLIEEAWLLPGPIPVVEWLKAAGAPRYAELVEREAASGRSVDGLRSRILQRWRRSGIATRLASGDRNARDSREVAGRLARRISGGDRP